MSWGGAIGAVLGGVVGFWAGGPWGMYVGASLGYMLGTYIDPVKVDKPSAGAPNSAQFYKLQFTSNTIGSPVPDVLGTAKLNGIFLAYGKERTVAQTQTTKTGGGGKGGGGGSTTTTTVTGYKYYMTFAEGICLGPVDELLAVYRDDDELVWSGRLVRPPSGGQETLTLEGYGAVTFYFGTDDQVANAAMATIIPDATLNTPFRGLCWALFDDCCIGDYHRVPSLKFVIRKTPVLSFSTLGAIKEYDYNPSHAIWYILTQMTGLPESWLNADKFSSVSSALYIEERGISMLFGTFQAASDYINSILQHIDGILRYGSDAKFAPKLIRQDYIAEELPLIDEAVILEDPAITRPGWIDTTNEIKVQYNEIANVTRVDSNYPAPLEAVYFGGGDAVVDKIDPVSFTKLGYATTPYGYGWYTMAIDSETEKMYLPSYDTPSRVTVVDLTLFDNISPDTEVGATFFDLKGTHPAERHPSCHTIDVDNGFLYIGVGLQWDPGTRHPRDMVGEDNAGIVKCDLSIPARSAFIDTREDGGAPASACIDTANGYAYFGLNTRPGKVVKVRLSDFTKVAVLEFPVGLGQLTSAVLDPFNGYAYFGNCVTVPGRIMKVRLSDFSYVGNMNTSIAEGNWLLTDFYSAVIDPYRGFAYFVSAHGLGCVLRINLYDFTKAGAVPFDLDYSPYEAYPRAAVIDINRNLAFFSTQTAPSYYIKVDLNSFMREPGNLIGTSSYSMSGGGL